MQRLSRRGNVEVSGLCISKLGMCVILGPITHLIPCTLLACSLNENSLCGLNKYGSGRYTTEGITALCEGLKQSTVTSLRCGACILNMRAIAVLITQLTLVCILFVFCSLAGNLLKVEGTKAIAAVLKDTKISNLK